MIGFENICAEVQIVMLKKKSDISEASNKNNKSNQKIWPLFVHQKHGNSTEQLRLHEINNFASFRRDSPSECINSSNGNNSETFHCAIGSVLGLAQLFGLFPLVGVRSTTPLQLRFEKLSIRTAYAFFVIGTILFMAILAIVHMIKTLNAETFEMRGGIATSTAGAIFYGNSLLGMIIFFWLSPRWVPLQWEWRAMERYIDSNTSEQPRLRWKFALISTIVLILALIEHILSIMNNTSEYKWSGSENATFRYFLEVYTKESHAFALETLEYNLAVGIYIFIVSKFATFTWNFTDLFIMLVSTGLAERYSALNKKVMVTVFSRQSASKWRELREDYALLSSIVKKVDNNISIVILLSFANNIYFICLQLLNGLSEGEGSTLLSTVYFFGSFGFLIGRTCAVTLLTARINDQSKIALPYLYTCSTSSYCIETERLQYQLTTDDVALTGLRFFSITRNFMLAVAGAIVTYEVVLLQFDVAIKK